MKFVVAFLPICIALFVSNLVYVLKYAGLAGFFIVLFFPIVFQLSSQWVCYRTFPTSDNIATKTTERVTDYGSYKSKSVSPHVQYDSAIYVQRNKEEKEPLLPQSKIDWRRTVIEFFFSRKAQRLSWTPYSTFLSHPLIVVIISFFAAICFILSVASLGVHAAN